MRDGILNSAVVRISKRISSTHRAPNMKILEEFQQQNAHMQNKNKSNMSIDFASSQGMSMLTF